MAITQAKRATSRSHQEFVLSNPGFTSYFQCLKFGVQTILVTRIRGMIKDR
jgi:hypothetical protein